MPLNFTPRPDKANPTQAQSTPKATPRPQVHFGTPPQSTARAEALKAKLTGKPAPQTAAPRHAGSTARAEAYAAQPKYGTPPPPVNTPIGGSTARQTQAGKEDFPAQPSGLAPGAQPPAASQITNDVESPKNTEANSEPLSPQFAALAKQERMIRKAQIELKAERARLQQEREGMISKSALTADPLKALSEAGVSYDRLVELQLNQEAPDPNQALLNKIAELEAKLTGVDEKFVARDKQAYDSAVSQIRNDAKLLVDSDPAFETIKSEGAHEDVVDLIRKVFDDEGIILPVEEACQLIETKLVDREYSRIERLTKLSKIKSRMAPPIESAEATPTEATAPKITTLTNNGSVTRPLSARDRAVLALKERMAKG